MSSTSPQFLELYALPNTASAGDELSGDIRDPDCSGDKTHEFSQTVIENMGRTRLGWQGQARVRDVELGRKHEDCRYGEEQRPL